MKGLRGIRTDILPFRCFGLLTLPLPLPPSPSPLPHNCCTHRRLISTEEVNAVRVDSQQNWFVLVCYFVNEFGRSLDLTPKENRPESKWDG